MTVRYWVKKSIHHSIDTAMKFQVLYTPRSTAIFLSLSLVRQTKHYWKINILKHKIWNKRTHEMFRDIWISFQNHQLINYSYNMYQVLHRDWWFMTSKRKNQITKTDQQRETRYYITVRLWRSLVLRWHAFGPQFRLYGRYLKWSALSIKRKLGDVEKSALLQEWYSEIVG